MRFLFIFCLFFQSLSFAEETESIHQLTNKQLLNQAQKFIGLGQEAFYADIRALATNQTLLNRHQNQPLYLKLDLNLVKYPDQAKTVVKMFSEQVEHLTRLQTLWQQRLQQLQKSERYIQSLLKNTELLEPYALEIQLRLQDKTLKDSKLSSQINLTKLEQQRKRYQQQKEVWKQQLEQANQQQKLVNKALKETQTQLTQAQKIAKQLTSNSKKQESRQSLENSLKNENNAELLQELKKLKEELEVLEGSFYLAQQKFNDYQYQLLSLKPTTAFNNMQSPASTGIETQLEAYQKQRNQIEQGLILLKKLSEQDKQLKQISSALKKHLSKFQLLDAILEERKIPQNENLQQKAIQLEQLIQQQEQKSSQLLANITNKQQQLEQQLQKIIKLQTQKPQTGASQEAVNPEKSWSQLVNTLSIAELIRNLEEKNTEFNATQEYLHQQQDLWIQKQLETESALEKLKNLKFPFYSVLAKQNQKLNQELEMRFGILPKAEKSQLSNDDLLENQSLNDWTSDLTGLKEHLKTFTQLLKNRVTLDNQREKLKKQLFEALVQEALQLESYVWHFEQEQLLYNQLNSLILEAKKRIARKQLKIKALPSDVLETKTLSDTNIKALKQRQQWITEQVLKVPAATMEEYSQLLQLAEKKYALVALLQKLTRQRETSAKNLSDTAKQTLKQKAQHALQTENGLIESFFILFNRENTAELNNLLIELYQQQIELTEKIAFIKQQQKQLKTLQQTTESEKDLINETLEALMQRLEKLKYDYSKQKELSEKITANKKQLRIAVTELFDLKINQLVIEKWIQLFNYRLSAKGISKELSIYQQQTATLNENLITLQTQLENLNKDLLFLRSQRQQVLQEKAFWVITKLLFILIMTFLIRYFIESFFWQRLEKTHNYLIPKIVRHIANSLLYLIAIMLITSFVFELSVTNILVLLGIFVFMLTFSLQNNLSNLFSAYTNRLEHLFEIGDVIEVNGYKGKVLNINWRSTEIEVGFAERVTIPNNLLANSSIKNYHAKKITLKDDSKQNASSTFLENTQINENK